VDTLLRVTSHKQTRELDSSFVVALGEGPGEVCHVYTVVAGDGRSRGQCGRRKGGRQLKRRWRHAFLAAADRDEAGALKQPGCTCGERRSGRASWATIPRRGGSASKKKEVEP